MLNYDAYISVYANGHDNIFFKSRSFSRIDQIPIFYNFSE